MMARFQGRTQQTVSHKLKSGPTSVFGNKVSLGYTYVPSFICYLWELSRANSRVEEFQQYLHGLRR